MQARRVSLVALAVLSWTALATAAAPLKEWNVKKPPGPGRLFPPGAETVKVYVSDESGELIQAAGFDGAEDMASFYGFWTRVPNGVQDLFTAASKDAVQALGMQWGAEGMVVSVAIRGYRIQAARRTSGPYHFFGYIRLQTMLRSGDGQDLRSADYRIADYCSGNGPDEAISGFFTRAAWQATAQILLAFFPRATDPEAVGRLAAGLDSPDPAVRARSAFWLGIVGGNDAGERLLAALRKETDLAAFGQIAAALASIGSPAAREEVASMLSGSAKEKGRDPSKPEEAWVLLDSMALFGDKEISSKTPPVREWRNRLSDLARFVSSGDLPVMSPAEAEARKASLEWITGKKK
ncbi:MAG TPA: HEAT repeat domain-containing protein [Thermoanaerobaculia bacterium]|nr:HEAT repeat domain-containing protein [Thermoanaerobaculia bacterium]